MWLHLITSIFLNYYWYVRVSVSIVSGICVLHMFYKQSCHTSVPSHVINMLSFTDIKVYQEKAIKDKERYQAEMEDYRDKMKTSIVTDSAGPLQQRFSEGDSALVDVDIKMHDSCQTPEESSSGESDYVADDINMDASSGGARVDSEAFVDSDKATKEGVIEVLSHCEGEVNAGGIQQTQKMNESQNMLSLL